MPKLTYERIIAQPELKKATESSAAFDIRGFFTDAYKEMLEDQGLNVDQVILPKGKSVVLRTGIKFNIPEGYVLKIYIRSGLGFKNDLTLTNCVGIIDSDYRKEVMLKLISPTESFLLIEGMRFAQGILEKVEKVDLVPGEVLDTTGRGSLGSTGVR
jgi:deoxyuridine 5'-triphosphate nucleotidohydrolase